MKSWEWYLTGPSLQVIRCTPSGFIFVWLEQRQEVIRSWDREHPRRRRSIVLEIIGEAAIFWVLGIERTRPSFANPSPLSSFPHWKSLNFIRWAKNLLTMLTSGHLKAMEPDGKIICKGGCGKYCTKPKSRYTAFTYHIASQHESNYADTYSDNKIWKRAVDRPMEAFNLDRYASPFAKNNRTNYHFALQFILVVFFRTDFC